MVKLHRALNLADCLSISMGSYLLLTTTLTVDGRSTLDASLQGLPKAPGWTAIKTLLNILAGAVIASVSGTQFESSWRQSPFSGGGLIAQISATMCLFSPPLTATGRLKDRVQSFFARPSSRASWQAA